MGDVFEIPCKSKAEAEGVAKNINDVSPDNVSAVAVRRPGGQWVVRVTVSAGG